MLCIKFTPTKQFFLKAGHLNRGDDHLNCGGVTSIVVGTWLIVSSYSEIISPNKFRYLESFDWAEALLPWVLLPENETW